MIFEGLTKFEFNLFILWDQLLLVWKDLASELFLLNFFNINLDPLLPLPIKPFFLLLYTPLCEVVLRFFVGLDENSILV